MSGFDDPGFGARSPRPVTGPIRRKQSPERAGFAQKWHQKVKETNKHQKISDKLKQKPFGYFESYLESRNSTSNYFNEKLF